MKLIMKQVSSLEKIRGGKVDGIAPVGNVTLLQGESFSYQIALETSDRTTTALTLESPLEQYITLYSVKATPADFPVYSDADDDYLIKEPGLMPDLLLPLCKENLFVRTTENASAVWVKVDLPRNIAAGHYPVTVTATASAGKNSDTAAISQTMWLNVPSSPSGSMWTALPISTKCPFTARSTGPSSISTWLWLPKWAST